MKMLIPLDGSEFAEEVLRTAADLAATSGAEVHLVEVVKDSKVHATWTSPPSPELVVGTRFDPSGGQIPGQPDRLGPGRVFAETKNQAWDRMEHEAEDYLDSVAKQYFPWGAEKTGHRW